MEDTLDLKTGRRGMTVKKSGPLKKRRHDASMQQINSGEERNIEFNVKDEEAAVAALASLCSSGHENGCIQSQSAASIEKHSAPPSTPSSSNTKKELDSKELTLHNHHVAGKDDSDRDSPPPKPLHAPPLKEMMVDHTYTDYSSIDESLMALFSNGPGDSLKDTALNGTFSPAEEKVIRKKLRKLKQMFGDISCTRKNSGGVVKPFPEKLMEVLDRGDMDHIISWMPHGRAFIVHDAKTFVRVVLAKFFKQSKFMSFTRQLNLWSFKRITKGVDAGAYYHELFLRGRPRLCMMMRRQKIKGTGIKLTPNPETEPNFYLLCKDKPLPPVHHCNKVEPFASLPTNGKLDNCSMTNVCAKECLPYGMESTDSIPSLPHFARIPQGSLSAAERRKACGVPVSFPLTSRGQNPYHTQQVQQQVPNAVHVNNYRQLSLPFMNHVKTHTNIKLEMEAIAAVKQRLFNDMHHLATAGQHWQQNKNALYQGIEGARNGSWEKTSAYIAQQQHAISLANHRNDRNFAHQLMAHQSNPIESPKPVSTNMDQYYYDAQIKSLMEKQFPS